MYPYPLYFYPMRFLTKLLIMSLAVFLIATLMPGVEVRDMFSAVLVATVLILLNIFVKPLLVFLTLPITVITLGLFLLVINASIILIASSLLKDGFQVNGFWVAMLFSVVLSMVTSLMEKAAEKTEKSAR